MSSELLTRDLVLQRLAASLDDDTLRSIFPGQHPGGIRRMLTAGLTEQEVSFPAAAPPVPKQPDAAAAGRCRLYTDGASRGNPGHAGAGAVLLDEQGEELAACSVYLGTCTNNVAEYKALLIGLDEALHRGCDRLSISLDSELIVRQIQGRYKVKNEALLPLYRQVRERLDRLAHWSVAHVPRAQNARADQLANQGIDQKNER